MSNQEKAAQGSAAAAKKAAKKVPYSKKSAAQKFAHICKACVFFLTMGFAYPNIFND